MCALTTTLDFQSTLRTVVCLADILVRIVVNVWIAVWIETRGMIVDILLAVPWIKTVIPTCLIVECHILCRTKILRESLCYMPASIGIGCNLKTVNLTTLGGDKDSALGCLCTIEHDSLCTLEECNLLNLRREYVV